MLLRYLRAMANYWATTDLSRPEFAKEREAKGETPMRLEGLVFSMLTMIDGGAMEMPAFKLVPHPHRDDAAFHRGEGSNWFPKGVDIADGAQLHEMWSGWPDPEA